MDVSFLIWCWTEYKAQNKSILCNLTTVPLLLASSTGDDEDPRFARPRDLDLIQSVPPVDLLNMKAPPQVLTLTEQPLDSLETDPTASSQNNPSQAVRVQSRFLFSIHFN